MKFYWKLNTKEKFIRSLWTGLILLLFVSVGLWCLEGISWKIVPFILVVIIELIYRYVQIVKEKRR